MSFHLLFGISFILVVLFFSSCAAVSPAVGGPVDEKGPVLLSSDPPNGLTQISRNGQITLKFDENLNPQSVPAAIKTTPVINFKIKTRGKFITLVPSDTLPDNSTIRIEISRSVRDYQDNKMAAAVSLVYSTGPKLSSSVIHGHLVDFNENSVSSVNLYSVYPQDSLELYAETEADSRGYFSFNYIEKRNYRIAALENPVLDFGKDLYKFNYGIAPHNRFQIKSVGDTLYTQIHMSENLEIHSINSVVFESQNHGNVTLSNDEFIPFFIRSDKFQDIEVFNHDYPENLNITFSENKDTIYFLLNLENHLHPYQTNIFKARMPELQDTISPELSGFSWTGDSLTLSFSEPVKYTSSQLNDLPGLDSSVNVIPGITHEYSYITPYDIKIFPIHDSIPEIKLPGIFFKDLSDSSTSIMDSILSINQKWSHKYENEFHSGGILSGQINYHGQFDIMVTARNIHSNEVSYVQTVDNNFLFSNLNSGKYSLFAFEIMNESDNTIYFSGIWQPFKRAARFGYLDKPIEIRPRWEVQGVELTIEPGVN